MWNNGNRDPQATPHDLSPSLTRKKMEFTTFSTDEFFVGSTLWNANVLMQH